MDNLKEVGKRLFSNIMELKDCWVWMGAVDNRGYGNIGIDSFKTERVHRVSYRIHFGDIPKGFNVLHKCDNKLCVRPFHLYLGTQAQNVKDAVNRNLFKPHPSRKLTFEQAEEVRELYKTGTFSKTYLAERFNVSIMVIRGILDYNMYKK